MSVLAEIPLPMVHTAIGLAVAAAEVLLRPEAVGLGRSAAADAGLALLTGLVLVAYDFMIYPSDSRPGPVGTALPMAAVLSFGTAGCNLACRFCQNWDISKSKEFDTLADAADPETIAAAAERLGCRSVAFTYNDPVIFLEYAVDVADACRARGIHAVAVTAGYVCEQPRRDFFAHIDAANVDLKGFTDDFYRHVCGGRLAPVLETLEYLVHETDVWVEIAACNRLA